LAENDYCGYLHLSGESRLTRFELAQRIARRLAIPTDLILPVNSNAIHGRAPRPNDVSLNNAKAKTILNTPMLSFTEGLELTLNYRDNKPPLKLWNSESTC